ncbi:MAG TPA: tetratricopeptide repeat protein [Blastocatellia bacterium]|nr:tetratricopeptide repeat protein [Blastocatellia bacterium]
MIPSARQLYEFGPFRLDAARGVLRRGEQVVPLTPRLLELLLAFVESGERVVEKDELMSRLWPDSIVEEANLTVNVSALRRALGQRGNENRYIVTVPGRGYRFVGEAKLVTLQETGMLLEHHTHTKIVIEEEDASEPAVAPARRQARRLPRPGRKQLAAIALLLALGSVVGYLWLSGRLQKSAAGGRFKSVAVLPFKLLGEGEGNEYLGVGMADALITRLSAIRQISVRPTSAMLRYARLEKEAVTVGQELQVDSVLEGSIRKSGERVRVTVQLVSVADGGPVWADKFDEPVSDVFTVEDRVSEKVAGALELRLTGAESRRLSRRYTDNTEAYQQYLKGRFFLSSGLVENIYNAIACFNNAIAADPAYALAYAGLADSYTYLGLVRISALSPHEAFPKARAAASRALAIDEELAEAHLSLALVRFRYDWDWAAAEQEFQRALELNPTYAVTHFWYAEFLRLMVRPDEVAREIALAYEYDPLSPGINLAKSIPAHMAGQYEQEAEIIKKVIERNPNYPHSYYALGTCYTLQGRYEEAIAVFEKGAGLVGRNPDLLGSLGYIYAKMGRRDEAQRVLEELRALSERQYVPPGMLAMVYLGFGQYEKALDWLEKSVDEHATGVVYIRSDSRFAPLRAYPKFAALLRRVGLAD